MISLKWMNLPCAGHSKRLGKHHPAEFSETHRSSHFEHTNTGLWTWTLHVVVFGHGLVYQASSPEPIQFHEFLSSFFLWSFQSEHLFAPINPPNQMKQTKRNLRLLSLSLSLHKKKEWPLPKSASCRTRAHSLFFFSLQSTAAQVAITARLTFVSGSSQTNASASK